jgi:hypothetical protein
MEPSPETAAAKQNGIPQDPQEDPRARDGETSHQDFQRVADNHGVNIVEGRPPSETEEPTCSVSV